MGKYRLKYGTSEISFSIPDTHIVKTLLPNEVDSDRTEEDLILSALSHPVGSNRLMDIVSADEKVAIITSDITRPLPSYKILPFILEELNAAGVKEENITVVFALGSHRKHTEEEKRKLVGDMIYESNIHLLDSDMDDCVRLGQCKNGTPVDIFKPVAYADKRICLGNVEYHYFAGYSGGSKALMPGVSSHEAIQANHSNMVHELAFAGNLDGNPVRDDIEEITDYISVDFILNVVLDDKKNIVHAVSGDVVKAHRDACFFLDKLYKVRIEKKADIVIFSPGGFPKDINIYQAQKGLDNAKHAVKDGGILIWCASASEGFGEKVFEDWMKNKTPEEMVEEIKTNFKLGGHKAAAISMVLLKNDIYFISDLDKELIKNIHMKPFNNVQEALDKAIEQMCIHSNIIIMPAANSTLPYLG